MPGAQGPETVLLHRCAQREAEALQADQVRRRDLGVRQAFLPQCELTRLITGAVSQASPAASGMLCTPVLTLAGWCFGGTPGQPARLPRPVPWPVASLLQMRIPGEPGDGMTRVARIRPVLPASLTSRSRDHAGTRPLHVRSQSRDGAGPRRSPPR